MIGRKKLSVCHFFFKVTSTHGSRWALSESSALKFMMKLGLMGLMSLVLQSNCAQTFPSKSITIVSPFAAGGPSDTIARTMAQKLSDALAVSVIVENRGGVGATLGTAYVAHAPADGYTLLIAGQSSLAFAPHLYKKLSYDPLKDFSPISNVALAPYALIVKSSMPAQSPAELIKLGLSQPGRYTFATSGAGSVSHLAMGMLSAVTGLDALQVPYKGMTPAVASILAGDVDMMFADLGSVDAFVRSGKLRVLAVSGRSRSALMPGLPTLMELGYKDLVAEGRFGFLAPVGTPRETVAKLHDILAQASQSPPVKERFASIGYEATTDTPEQFLALMKSDHERFGRLIKQLKISAE
jgi:tripartite-type tricarboxylate transporter receptor subunit TctC